MPHVPASPKPTYLSALDLGQAQELTALAVLERTLVPEPKAPQRCVRHYAVRHLERFALGTPYAEIAGCLAQRFAEPPLAKTQLLVDVTMVGRPVLEELKRSRLLAQLAPVIITSGHQVGVGDGGATMIPKKELVSTLQVLLQARRLKIAPALPEAEMLLSELMNFQLRMPPTGGDEIADWREAPHDDLVFAVAIAAWQSERERSPTIFQGQILRSGWQHGEKIF